MKNADQYNHFIESLEPDAKMALFFHHIADYMYITDGNHRLLGIWDLNLGHELDKSTYKMNNLNAPQL